jgi:hypothetical protein
MQGIMQYFLLLRTHDCAVNNHKESMTVRSITIRTHVGLTISAHKSESEAQRISCDFCMKKAFVKVITLLELLWLLGLLWLLVLLGLYAALRKDARLIGLYAVLRKDARMIGLYACAKKRRSDYDECRTIQNGSHCLIVPNSANISDRMKLPATE